MAIDVLREQAWSVVKALRVRKQAAEDLGCRSEEELTSTSGRRAP